MFKNVTERKSKIQQLESFSSQNEFHINQADTRALFVTHLALKNVFFCGGKDNLKRKNQQLFEYAIEAERSELGFVSLFAPCHVFGYICATTRMSALKNLTFPNYKCGKGLYTFYPIKLSCFAEKN